MKILIAGSGEVALHLAKLLLFDQHDITLVDNPSSRLEQIAKALDLLVVEGSPTSIATLKEANAGKVDLFIGVTPEESKNMTCCMLAKELGAKRTVARVENKEYTAPDSVAFFKRLGIDSIVYPEQLAAQEINHLISRPWARQWWEVQGGELMLFGVKVRRGVEVLGKELRTIDSGERFHITAIQRQGSTILPTGQDCLEENDLVFVMTTKAYIPEVRALLGKSHTPKAHTVFYMGGSDTVLHSICTLPEDIQVKLFDNDPTHFDKILNKTKDHKLLIINGDGRDLDLLKEENIEQAQVFVAATKNSETNILACLSAKQMGVPKTIAMVENTDYISLAQNLDVGLIINKKTFAAGSIYRLLLKADVQSIKSLNVAQAEVVEYKVCEKSLILKKSLMDLKLPRTINIGGYIRDGVGHIAHGTTVFQPGDIVVAFCLKGQIKKLEKFFKHL